MRRPDAIVKDLTPASPGPLVRAIRQEDLAAWKPLWDGYNAFYGRVGKSALAEATTQVTWQRFFDPAEPVFALVAEIDGKLVGLAHYLFHRSTTRVGPVCYLQDLFTDEAARGHGVGRALVLRLTAPLRPHHRGDFPCPPSDPYPRREAGVQEHLIFH